MKAFIIRGIFLWSAVLGLIAAAGALAVSAAEAPPQSTTSRLQYEEPRELTASIYGLSTDRQKLLFQFHRQSTRSGNRLDVQRDYTYPDGRLASREHVLYDGDTMLLYELNELQIGAHGSARIRPPTNAREKGTIEFEYTAGPGQRAKVSTEPLVANTLIGDMVGPFLVKHWEALARGEPVKCRYIVVPRRETVGFTFAKDAAKPVRDALVVRMEPSSRFLAALVDPLFFTITQAPPHHVLQYTGRTTPRKQAGDKWKELDAITVFDWESAR